MFFKIILFWSQIAKFILTSYSPCCFSKIVALIDSDDKRKALPIRCPTKVQFLIESCYKPTEQMCYVALSEIWLFSLNISHENPQKPKRRSNNDRSDKILVDHLVL